MIRQQKKRKTKQEKKVEKIVNDFLRMYNSEITTAKGLVLEDNRKREISQVNMHFLKVWRGVIAHIKTVFPLVHLDRNYFSKKIVWE